MLELKKITKVYETDNIKVEALKGIDLKFRENEFVSILGQSGCGKTTLLNIVGGLDQYTTGDLVINGKSTKEFTDRDWDTYRNHRVGFVFQNYNLIPHQTVLANVELALTLAGTSKNERRKRAIEVLESVGLKDQLYKKPNQMSGGQMQRVAIARALVSDPDILLADEPTGALDSKTSIQIMELLKEISKTRLVIMVTHNPEIANAYSTRIIKLLDGNVIDDSNPYEGSKVEEGIKNLKKTFMSFKTAISLSLNNLLTKKGRTILTAFAGSIGIIGIALIMSLSNGIQEYIDRVEEETLSSYPLVIQRETVDMEGMLTSLAGEADESSYVEGKINSANIMGDIFTTLTQQVEKNDLKSFKEFIESDKSNIKDFTSNIQYGYNVQMNLYKNDPDKVLQVNPTTVFDAVGLNTGAISSVYSGYMSNYDVFFEMLDNDELNKQQYDLVDGKWPEKYNELVLVVGKDNSIADYTLYSLGILDQDYLKEQFNKMVMGEEVTFEQTSYDTDELIGLEFKLLLNTDYYKKSNNIWMDMRKDEAFMKKAIKNAETIKIVGIIKPNDEAVVGAASYGTVGYQSELMDHLITEINESKIVKEQLKNKDINVFTNQEFKENEKFDINSLSPEQLAYIQNMSSSELAEFMQNMSENFGATYEQNLNKLGVADLTDPYSISIYPKDFDSKEEITKIIEEYNKDFEESEKIKYTDIVGIMMSSVSTIVDVISKVLIAFVAISLVVSSIMIGIITYISVLERTKEIGILRSIGASKKDIRRVFNAETMIIGLTSGVLGILVTLVLNIPINIIIKDMTNISNISVLPIIGAIALIIISVILTLIAGLIPSNVAAKKDPGIALRTE